MGRFHTFRPAAPLREYVDVLWHVNGAEPVPERELVLPSTSAEMVIALHNSPYRLLDAAQKRVLSMNTRGVVCGLRTSPVVLDLDFPHDDMGVHFKPGAAAAVLGVPIDEIGPSQIDFAQVLGPQADALRLELGIAADIQERFKVLEKFLTDQLLCSRPSRLHCVEIDYAVRLFMHRSGNCDVSDTAKKIGWSGKKFRSRFSKQVGLTPKSFCRIARLEAVLHHLQSPARTHSFADAAIEFGYFDQSHMINDFRQLTGMTPAEYARCEKKSFNHLPV